MRQQTAFFKFYPNFHKETKSGEIPIYLRVVIARKKFELSLKQFLPKTVATEQWNERLGLLNSNFYPKVTKEIARIRKIVEDIVLRCQLDNVPLSVQVVRSKILMSQDGREELLAYHAYYMSKFVEVDPEKAIGTKINYRKYHKHLKAFLISTRQQNLRVSESSGKLISDFQQFLTSPPTGSLRKPQSKESRAGHLKKLKTILMKARLEGMLKTNPFEDFRIPRNTLRSTVFLQEEEYRRLCRLDLSTNSSLDRVKDVFLFSCFCGLAFSDAMSLKITDFLRSEKGYYLEKARVKSGEAFLFYLPERALAILKKYGSIQERTLYGYILPRISEPKFNLFIKVVGERAEVRTKLTHHLARKFCNRSLSLAGVEQDSKNLMLGWALRTNEKIYQDLSSEPFLLITKRKLDEYYDRL
jgi:integrase/recombinase XerD